jgi:hypothetical protein
LFSGSSDLPFVNIGRHKWLRLILITAGVYLVLLPLWWQSLEGLSIVIAACADLIYGVFDPRVSIFADGDNVNVAVTATEQSGFGGQVQSSALRLSTITYGLPMLMALVLSTRADTILAKLKALGVGLAAMLLLTVPAVMVWAAMTGLQLEDRITLATLRINADRSSFLYYLFHGYAFSQPVFAVGVWMGLMMLGFFKRQPKEQEAPAAVLGRNDPCGCGSGRKYKRCCGKAK